LRLIIDGSLPLNYTIDIQCCNSMVGYFGKGCGADIIFLIIEYFI